MKQTRNAKESNPAPWPHDRSLSDCHSKKHSAEPRGFASVLSIGKRAAALAAVAATLSLAATSGQAALLAYEGFNYTNGTGNLTGFNGGFGWQGIWQTVNNGSASVQSGNLAAGSNAPAGYDSHSIGNSAFTPNGTRSGRFLNTSTGGSFSNEGYIDGNGNVGAAGKTLYISFMQQPNGVNSYYEFEFHRSDLGDPGRVGGIGNDSGPSANVYLRVPSAAQTLVGPGSTSVNFYVVRIDFQGGNDTVSVYQNPTSTTEPGTPTLTMTGAGDMSFNGISFGAFDNGRTVAHDEVRLGETWVDVTSPGIYSAGIWDGGGANGNWSTAGNWDNDVVPVFASSLTFTGSNHLSNNNDLTGVSANGITFDAAAGAFVITGNSLGLNGDIGFSGNLVAPITQTLNLPLTPNQDITINTPTNGNISLGGGVSSVNWLTKIGDGTLTLAGTNVFGSFSDSGGTNIITGDVTFNGQNNGHKFYIADGPFIPNVTSTLILQPGATLSVIGTYGDAGVIGRDGGSGTFIQNGGLFSFAPANQIYLFIGASSSTNTKSEYDMNGGVLDMNGNTLGLGLGANAVINGTLNQAGGVITNVNQMYFSPFFTQGKGFYNVTGGTIYIGGGGMTVFNGGAYQINLGGGTIAAQASWSSSLNLSLTGSNGPVTFNPAGNIITLSGILSGPGGLKVAGGGSLELSGANTYTGDTLVESGSILQLDNTGSIPGAIRVASGGSLFLNFSGNFAAGALYTNGVALPVGSYDSSSLPGFISGSGTVQVTTGISTGLWTGAGANGNWSTVGNWDNNAVPIFPHAVTFAGNSQLNNNNDLSSISISSITFDSAAGPFVIGGNDVNLTGAIGFNGMPVAPITQTLNLNMNWTVDETIALPTNANLTLNGNINATGSLIQTGTGALTLGGTDSFAGYYIDGGTNVINGNVTINSMPGYRIYLGEAAGTFGHVLMNNGSSLTMTGNFDDTFVIGRDGGSGTFVQNGGTFTFSPGTPRTLFVGATSQPGTQAEYDLNGGVLDMGGNALGISLGDQGTVYTAYLKQTGGSIINLANLDLGAARAFGHGVYILSGGSITVDVGGITSDSGSYEVDLGGGTVGASSSWASSLNMTLTNFNGSVTFNPSGNNITLNGVLSGAGGLIVNGGGSLILTATNTYTGDTVVTAGSTLELDAATGLPSVVRITNGATLNLNYSGTVIVPALYNNGSALPPGTYNSGNLTGIIGSGNIQVTGLVFTSQPQSQPVYLNQGNSATLTASVTGGSATYQWFLNGNAIPGATNSTLTLTGLQITNGGSYDVVATGASGSITSSVAAITIYAINNHVFVYDGFNYDPGSVDGTSQDGGFGWNGPWQQTDGSGVIIAPGSLVADGSAPVGFDSRSIGNSIEVPSNAQTRSGRYFDCTTNSDLFNQGFIDANGNIGADGKTIYLGFLQQPDRTSGFYEMEFHRANLSDPGRIGGIGNDTGTGNVNLRAPNSVNNRSLGAGTTAVNLYVVRIDYKAGNDDVYVYRNPTSSSEPATPTLVATNVADMSFNGLSVAAYNGPDVKHDEIRLGATFEDAIGMAVSNLLPPAKTDNGYKIQFSFTPGYTYRIQRATSVSGPWTDLTTGVAPANAYVEYVDTTAPAGGAFYRTVTP